MKQTAILSRKSAIWLTVVIISALLAVMVKMLFPPLAAQIHIGTTMNKFAEDKTQPIDIDFSTAVSGETPHTSPLNHKQYPALEKYQIEVMHQSNDVIYIGGSDRELWLDSRYGDMSKPIDFEEQNTRAHIFRSTDEGKSFTKIILGRGEVNDIMGYKNHVFAKVYDPIPKRYEYYRSTDNGQTWKANDWFPIQIWDDGVMFMADEEGNGLRLSMDAGATWRIPSSAFNDFYQATKPPLFSFNHGPGRMFDYPPLQELNDNTVVGMNKDKEILYFDLKTQTTQKQHFNIPENKNIVGFVVNNNQLGLQIEDYEVTENAGTPNESIKKQMAFYFPETQEYAHFPKHLPAVFDLHVQDDYIGGIGFINGERVHVYTKDRGKQWYYQVLYSYEPHVPETWLYANGYVFSAMHNWSKQGAFIVKLKPL
jgi:hypothetical protein